MTQDKVCEVARFYALRLIREGACARQGGERYDHVCWMCDEVQRMNDFEKANRWLGFIQGFLWTVGIYTIDQMREHNR